MRHVLRLLVGITVMVVMASVPLWFKYFMFGAVTAFLLVGAYVIGVLILEKLP